MQTPNFYYNQHAESIQEKDINFASKLIKNSQIQTRVEEIIKYYNKTYQNILPQKYNQNQLQNQYYFPFEKNQLCEIMDTLDIAIQLIIQNLLLCKNDEIRLKSFNLITDLVSKKTNQAQWNKLPEYKINLSDFRINYDKEIMNPKHKIQNHLIFYAKPQVSLYHSPLLDFTDVFYEIMRRNHEKDVVLNILYEQFPPLINPNWRIKNQFIYVVPLQNTDSVKNQKGRFSYLDDNLFLLGLNKYGFKQLNMIQKEFLFDKQIPELKNRFKNQITNKAQDNLIKKWNFQQINPLTVVEKMKFKKGLEWFQNDADNQPKWQLISRYFLPERSPSFLQEQIYLNSYNNLILHLSQTHQYLKQQIFKQNLRELNNGQELLKKRKRFQMNQQNDSKQQDYFLLSKNSDEIDKKQIIQENDAQFFQNQYEKCYFTDSDNEKDDQFDEITIENGLKKFKKIDQYIYEIYEID